MEYVARILLFLAIIKAGQAAFTITEILDPDVDKTVDQTVWHEGDSNLELSCSIEGDFVGGVHIVKWKKSQPLLYENGEWERNPEEYPISSAGLVDEGTAFKAEGRFSIKYSNPKGKSIYTLVIERPEPEDTGRYRCFASDGDTSQNLIYRVAIHVEADSVQLTGKPDDNEVNVNETEGEDRDAGPLVYYSNSEGSLGCTSVGGYPIPLLNFYVNDQNGKRNETLSRGFDRTYSEEDQLIGDKLGLQRYNFQVTETNSKFSAKPQYDGGTLECEAKPSSLVAAVTQKRRVEILAPPYFIATDCVPVAWAQVGDANFVITCHFRTSTAAKTIHWEAETGQVLEQTDRDGYLSTSMTLVAGEDSVFEAKLMFDEVTSESFQTYKISVENEVGWSHHDIALKQGSDPERVCDPENESCGAQRMATLFTSVIFTAAVAAAAFVTLRF